MKVKNQTTYRTADLRKLFTATLRKFETDEGKIEPYIKRRLVIQIKRSKTHRVRGNAILNGFHVNLWLSKEATPNLVAWIFDHELFHIVGYKHSQMGPGKTAGRTPPDFDWANIFPLREKKVKPKKKEDLQVKRYRHTIKMVEDKTGKIKRLTGQLKKWQRKRKYYERVLLAAGKITDNS